MYVATIRTATPDKWIIRPESVFDWCNNNLEHPVSFVTTKQKLSDTNFNYKIHKRKLNWKSPKDKLETISDARYDLFLTFQFETKDDFTLFVIRWGSLPNRGNYRLRQVAYHFLGITHLLTTSEENIEAKILELIEQA